MSTPTRLDGVIAQHLEHPAADLDFGNKPKRLEQDFETDLKPIILISIAISLKRIADLLETKS
jgi:hypothetical protein